MKNLFAMFLCLLIISFSVNFVKNDVFDDLCGSAVVVASAQEYLAGLSVVESAGKAYISCDISQLKTVKNHTKNIYGISLKIQNYSLQQFLKKYNIKIVKQELVSDKNVYYGYSNSFFGHIFVDNKMTNVQIVDGEELIVGLPIVYDCF